MTQYVYRWFSEYLRNYGRGQIIIIASSIDEARIIARGLFEADLRECHCYIDIPGFEDERPHETAKFEADIAKEPCIITDGIFVSGSE